MKKYVFVVATLLVCLFQNCAKNIAVEDIAGQKTSIGEFENVDTAPDEEVHILPYEPQQVIPGPGAVGTNTVPVSEVPTYTEFKQTCENAKATNKLMKKTLRASFSDPKKVCAWSSGRNLSPENTKIRARREQVVTLDLSIGSKVCSLKMTNIEQQQFYYDDNIFLTLNSFVLASTSNFSRHLVQKNGYHQYDWNKLVDKNAQNLAEDTVEAKQYCAGESAGLSNCSFPSTETYGKLVLDFKDEVIQKVLTMTSVNQIKLGVVTTGDDDETDCQHAPIYLDVDVYYYE